MVADVEPGVNRMRVGAGVGLGVGGCGVAVDGSVVDVGGTGVGVGAAGVTVGGSDVGVCGAGLGVGACGDEQADIKRTNKENVKAKRALLFFMVTFPHQKGNCSACYSFYSHRACNPAS